MSRESLRLVCELVGAIVLAGMAVTLLWFAVALVVAVVRDWISRRRRRLYVPRQWVEAEAHRHGHPARGNR